MANENIKVTISGNLGTSYYVYFVNGDLATSQSISLAYKRFRLDDSTYNQTFPNLVANNWYLADDVNVGDDSNPHEYVDTYIGMRVKTEDATLTSIIYSNKLLDKTTQFNNAYVVSSDIDSINKLDDTNWIFKISILKDEEATYYPKIKSYIIDFISSTDEQTDREKIFIKYHEIDSSSHQKDIAYFVSDRTSESIIASKLWDFNQETSYSKMNGVYTGRAYTHRMKYAGTPLTVNFENYKLVKRQDAYNTIREGASECIDVYNELINREVLVQNVRRSSYECI